MQKRSVRAVNLAILSVAIILLASMFVYAAGESTTRTANNSNVNKTERNATNSRVIDCESSSNRTERIKCRLENREEIKARVVERIKAFNNDTSTYEACQGLRNEGLCVALYAQSQRCYRLNDTERDRCFKKIVRFREAQINKSIEVEANKTEARERVRHYMILVLYNLQEKVEKANEKGRISNENAAEIINKIVEIKRAILEGATKAEIRSQLAELKQLWRTALGKVNNEGGEATE